MEKTKDYHWGFWRGLAIGLLVGIAAEASATKGEVERLNATLKHYQETIEKLIGNDWPNETKEIKVAP